MTPCVAAPPISAFNAVQLLGDHPAALRADLDAGGLEPDASKLEPVGNHWKLVIFMVIYRGLMGFNGDSMVIQC